jgi:hypothetical protein
MLIGDALLDGRVGSIIRPALPAEPGGVFPAPLIPLMRRCLGQ